VTAAVHLQWMVAKEEVSVAEVSEVEEAAVEVEGMSVFSFKRDSAPSATAVDSHMRAPELVAVVEAVSEEVQITVPLKEVEDRGLGLLADSKEEEADSASQWEQWELTVVIPSKEVRLVTVSQTFMVLKEVSPIVTVLRVYRQEVTEVRLISKVFTVVPADTLKERRVATNSRWGVVVVVVVDTMHSLQERSVNLEVTHSKAAVQPTLHRRVQTTSNLVDIQVAELMDSNR